MSEIIRRQLDALAATMQIGLAQIETLRHAIPADAPKGARISLPDRCMGVDREQCAEQDGEWLSKSTLGDPGAKKCKGCGVLKSGLVVS